MKEIRKLMLAKQPSVSVVKKRRVREMTTRKVEARLEMIRSENDELERQLEGRRKMEGRGPKTGLQRERMKEERGLVKVKWTRLGRNGREVGRTAVRVVDGGKRERANAKYEDVGGKKGNWTDRGTEAVDEDVKIKKEKL